MKRPEDFALIHNTAPLAGEPPTLAQVFPLHSGNQWTYQGTAQWTVPGTTDVRSAAVKWVMKIVATAAGDRGRAAVVRGYVTELGFYEPDREPGFAVLFAQGNRLYRLDAADSAEAAVLARRVTAPPDTVLDDEQVVLELPLEAGQRWGGVPSREDGMYCWMVDRKERGGFVLSYRSLGSHESVTFRPGTGVARYAFEHHGTAASAEVKLVKFVPGSRRKR
jgi:hypothetical protein